MSSDRKHALGIVALLVIIVLALVLTGCGADEGGVPGNEEETSNIEYEGAPDGVDKQVIETYDSNVEVQKVTVGGIDCVIAVRNDNPDVAISCP